MMRVDRMSNRLLHRICLCIVRLVVGAVSVTVCCQDGEVLR